MALVQLPADRAYSETRNATVFSFDYAETFTPRIRQQDQSSERIHPAMSFKRSLQIDVGNDLSVHDEKRVAIEELTRVVQRATRSEDLRFFDVVQLNSEAAAVAQCLTNRLGPVMQVDD